MGTEFLSKDRVGFRQDAVLVHETEIAGVVAVLVLSHDEHDSLAKSGVHWTPNPV